MFSKLCNKQGSDEDCPKGESCHGGTTCNLIDLLIKAETPDGLPTLKPTMPPREDQSNMRFCGESWDSAAASCSLGKSYYFSLQKWQLPCCLYLPVCCAYCFSKRRIVLMEIVRKAKFATVVQSVMLMISHINQLYLHL